ncbi:hypothetical protein [Sphingomonas sp. SRS2]|uniref:hypothetical protein n=1 Tax=Sphingomonas sp. SRS2 TaxID=133190 RepID=UPI0006184470|nr:hypothetical protein [Sphingomonas sp. SRS2]KKC27139.1 hypothetical protein WP12_04955 [Sphingomonas sp. SRS2]
MIEAIGAGLGSLKAAKDIVQALNGIQTAAAINDVKLTLQGHILEAQQGLFAAQEAQTASAQRVNELTAEIQRLRDWSSEKQRYELKNIGVGTFAYMLRPDERRDDPPYWLCTRCFDDGQKSILQFQGRGNDARQVVHSCSRCKATFATRPWVKPAYDAEPDED